MRRSPKFVKISTLKAPNSSIINRGISQKLPKDILNQVQVKNDESSFDFQNQKDDFNRAAFLIGCLEQNEMTLNSLTHLEQ